MTKCIGQISGIVLANDGLVGDERSEGLGLGAGGWVLLVEYGLEGGKLVELSLRKNFTR